MNNWLNQSTRNASPPTKQLDERAERQLRRMDITLAGVASILGALPMGLALMVGQLRATEYRGTRQIFRRWHVEFPANFLGRALKKTGIGAWPVLLNILRGEMAWVGPKPVAVDSQSESESQLPALRPGLVNIWTMRERTAVHFGSEKDADLEYMENRGLRHDMGLLLRALLVSWMPLPRVAESGRIGVGDVSFDNVNMTQALDQIEAMLSGNTTQQVSFVNPACVNIAAGNRGYRRILARAAMVLPDGIGIKIAADLMGRPLKQNVNGTDLFAPLCERFEARGASLFLLGGQPGVAERVAAVIHENWPGLRIAGLRDGFFTVAQEGEVAAEVRKSKADVLLVARGVPMQDVFIDRQLHQLGVKVALGVGGLFDFVSGRINRAPVWMRDSGLEWIYRFMQEPKRMWRRYLLGNFTFLGRILLQRVGLRQPANDNLVQQAPVPARDKQSNPELRTVLFATRTAPPDVPVPDGFPSALLPFGCSTFIEKTLNQLADAGIKQVDLVVSGHPEQLRSLLGNGERWGMNLRWHLAKDASKPYGILQSLGLERAQRVLLGHAEQWIEESAVRALLKNDQTLVQTKKQTDLLWAGWASTTPSLLDGVSPHCDEADLASLLIASGGQIRILKSTRWMDVRSAAQLLDAQRLALTDDLMQEVPATWIRTVWGAHSPDAVVQAGAQVQGPALIGPGCFVAAGASVGPTTVLSSNVVVSAGAGVCDSLILPHTFVGKGLNLEGTVVQGCAVQNIRLNVRTVLPRSEGLLQDLADPQALGTSWLSRLSATILCLVLSPLVALDTGLRRLRGLPLRWHMQLVALGRDTDTGTVRMQSLRCVRATESGLGRMLANYGLLLDVAAGQRAWYGARPRSLSEWYALGRDWQLLLANAPVGCMHASAWSEGEGESLESKAAADVFFAVNRSAGLKARIFFAVLSRNLA